MKKLADENGIISVSQDSVDYIMSALELYLKNIIAKTIQFNSKVVKETERSNDSLYYIDYQPITDPFLITPKDLITTLELEPIQIPIKEKIQDWDLY